MNEGNSSYTLYTLNDYHWETALKRVENAPIYENSHRKEMANEVGFLGEVIAECWFDKNQILFKDERTKTTHDYLINNKFTLDVKTKDRTVLPKAYYDNSVPLYNHDHQRPDYFLFISLVRDNAAHSKYDKTDIRRFRKACIVGAIDIQSLEKLGKTWREGETDTSNGTTFWTDCININMKQLISLKRIINIWRTT